jgi:hypothetical protein
MSVPQLPPGQPGQMLGDALQYVKSLPRDALQRADAFEALAKLIESHSGGAWTAARGTPRQPEILPRLTNVYHDLNDYAAFQASCERLVAVM